MTPTPALAAFLQSTSAGGAGPPGLVVEVGVRFVASLLVLLVVGGAAFAVADRWCYDVVREAHDDLGPAVLAGVVGPFAAGIVAVLFAITIVGIVVAIPLLLLVGAVGVVGTPLGATVVGGRLVGRTSYADRWVALVVGSVAVAAVTAVPLVGRLGNLVLTSPGVGVLLLRSWRYVTN